MVRVRSLLVIVLGTVIGLGSVSACRKSEPEPTNRANAAAEPIGKEDQPKSPTPSRSGRVKQTTPPIAKSAADAEKIAARRAKRFEAKRKAKAAAKAAAKGARPPATATRSGPLILGPEETAAINELLTAWESVRSVSATLENNFHQPKGLRELHELKGTRDCLKKGDQMLVRTYYFNAVSIEKEAGGNDWIITAQRVSKVFDGEYLYEVDERHEGKTATKRRLKPGQIQPIGGVRLFAGVPGLGSYVLLPDQTLDGKEVYAFEGKTRDGAITIQHHFDKQTGILIKRTTENSITEIESEFLLSDVKVNVEFSEDHFEFILPDDVELQDLTETEPRNSPPPTQP